MSTVDELVNSYIVGEKLDEETKRRRRHSVAWFGESHRRDKDIVKELAAFNTDGFNKSIWDPEMKLWGTLRLENVVSLIASGVWSPCGIEEHADLVALKAKAIVDDANRKEAERVAAAKREERLAAEKRTSDSIKAELLRREREHSDRGFTDEDYEFALTNFGMTRGMLDATLKFNWLGGHTCRSMLRVTRWFNFSHNKLAGVAAVIERDFAPAFKGMETDAKRTKKRARSELDSEASISALAWPAPAASTSTTMAELRAAEAKRRKAIEDQRAAAENDPHTIALNAIVEKSRKVPLPKPPFAKPCPDCNVVVSEQFLECWCDDAASGDWRRCDVCNSLFNPTKLRCLCALGLL